MPLGLSCVAENRIKPVIALVAGVELPAVVSEQPRRLEHQLAALQSPFPLPFWERGATDHFQPEVIGIRFGKFPAQALRDEFRAGQRVAQRDTKLREVLAQDASQSDGVVPAFVPALPLRSGPCG